MAACMNIKRHLLILGDMTTYCRVNAAFRILKRGKVAIPKPNYRMDKEGNKVYVNQVGFPAVLDIDPAVAEACEYPPRDLKYHPGIMSSKVAPLPERLVKNARILLAEKNCLQNPNYLNLVSQLQDIFKCRQPPVEKAHADKELQRGYKHFYDELLERGLDPDTLDEKDREAIEKYAQKTFYQTHHNWKQFKFDAKNSLIYMGLRLAPNYRVLYQIFHEIHQRDKDFVPSAIYNFGSGLGTAIWAADAIWGKKVFEYYNVDRSGEMNKLAQQLLSKDVLDENSSSIINGVHFRQNPLSDQKNNEQFKLVVNAYSLMDQPSRLDRLAMIDSLWNLTSDYLVLVEQGSRAGYRLIQEARDFIIWENKKECHVFAPCPHEKACPKAGLASKENCCSFDLEYKPLIMGKQNIESPRNMTDSYTYVVMKKGPRGDGPGYPRILHVDSKSQMSACHLCCRDGTLRNYIITKSKPSKMLLLAAKKSKSGDFLPLRWPNEAEMEKLEEDDGEEEEISRSKLNKLRKKERRMMTTEEAEKENEFLDSMISMNKQQTDIMGDFDGYEPEYDDIKDSVKFDPDQYNRYGDINDNMRPEGTLDSDGVSTSVIDSDIKAESSTIVETSESDFK